jgi:nucleoid DNA-binding protein
MARSKKALIQSLASKHNLPLSTVEEIINSQFKYVAKIMRDETVDAIRLPYFGNFWVKKGRVDCVTKRKKKKDGAVNDK